MVTNRKICKRLASLLLAFALVAGSFALLPAETYAKSSADIKTGDYIDVGRTDAAGYTGVPHWRVLDKASDGSMLLMSEYLWRGNGEDAAAGVKFVNATGSEGQTKEVNGEVFNWRGTNAEVWCDAFYEAVLADIPKLTVKPTTASDEEYTYQQTLYGEEYNKEIHFREAKTVMYENKVFFLSAEEAAQYIPDPRERKAHLPDNTSEQWWLLRSTQSSTNWASEIKPDGEIAAVTANTARAVRPVFWAVFDDGTYFESATDENGKVTWTVGGGSDDPQGDDPQKDPDNPGGDPQKDPVDQADNPQDDGQGQNADPQKKPAAEEAAKAVKVKTVTVNVKTVNAKAIDKAITKAGGSRKYVTKIVLGKKVRKISAGAFKSYKKVTAIEVKTKKLTKKSVKKALKGSKVKTIKVRVASKASVNKKYINKYKKIFTKKNAGKKVKVKK